MAKKSRATKPRWVIDKPRAIREILEVHRLAHRMTWQDLAGEIGMSPVEVCEMLVGRRPMTADVIEKVMGALAVTSFDLLFMLDRAERGKDYRFTAGTRTWMVDFPRMDDYPEDPDSSATTEELLERIQLTPADFVAVDATPEEEAEYRDRRAWAIRIQCLVCRNAYAFSAIGKPDDGRIWQDWGEITAHRQMHARRQLPADKEIQRQQDMELRKAAMAEQWEEDLEQDRQAELAHQEWLRQKEEEA